MDAMTAARRLRLWLRIWGVLFSLGVIDFLLLPVQTVKFLNELGKTFGFAPATALEQTGFWVPLAAAYMVLISAFCWDSQRANKPIARPVRYLVLAKLASASFALGWFFFAGLQFPMLAAGVIDAFIAAGTLWLLRDARPLLS